MKGFYATTLLICFCLSSCISSNLSYEDAVNRNNRKLESEEQRMDAEFLVDAADYNILLKELASRASLEAYSRVVSQFASQILQDHKGMGDRLRSVAKEEDVYIPSNIEGRHQDLLNDLERADKENFDRTYLNIIGILQDRMLRIYEDAAINANDAEVRSYAAAQLDLIRAHSQKAREIRRQLI